MTWLVLVSLAAAPLGFEQALARADDAPDVVSAEAAASQRRDSVSQIPLITNNPLLVVQPALRNESGTTRPEAQFSVTQAFNVAGLGPARREVAAHDAATAHALALERRWQRRVQVARAWLDTWAADAAVKAAAEDVRNAEELVARLTSAEARGGVTKADLASARAFAAEARAFMLGWEGRAVEAGATLAMLLGLEDLATVEGAPPAVDEPSMDAAPRVPPHVRLVDAQLAAANARALEAAAQWGTSMQVSLAGAHEAPGTWIAGLGLGVTLPVFERGQFESGTQRMLATRLKGELEVVRRQARVDLQLMKHELEHTRETFEVVHGEQLPQALEAARFESRRFEQGETTLQELLLVRRQVLTARAAAVVAEADLLAARVKARELLAIPGSEQP